MKTLFKLTLIVLSVTIFSCSNDDDSTSTQITIPIVSFSNPNITTPFFTDGQTEVPSVSWNGNIGLFSLASNIPGTSVDTNTGIISWSKALPIGSNTIQLVATNSAGQTSVNVIIDNQFSGNFDGNYNYDPNSTSITGTSFEINFNADGTAEVFDFGSPAIGTWTRVSNTMTIVYSYDSGVNFYTVVADVSHSETDATITGYWSDGEILTDPAFGYLELELE